MNKETLFHIAIYLAASALVFAIIYFTDAYLNISHEASISWGLLAMAIILNRVESFKHVPGRVIFIFIAGLITLRYFIWRTFDTLIYVGPLDMVGMALIYAAEVYAVAIHFLGMFVSLWPLERSPMPLPDDPSILPTVDILIPTYNESEEIVKLTAVAATQIDYPKEKLNIYILDDGATTARRNNKETSQSAWERYHRFSGMAQDLDVHYIAREENIHAKAGNLNHALKKTGGDLVLILDCDHVPTRDILKNTVGYFLKDKKLFLAQTPHFFINPTTVEKNIGSFSNAPGENDMFYHSVHLGLDFWNASYFCGSAALLRRKYLMEIGGISGHTITEDAETSLHLHNRGYNSVFIKRPMICGLSPETFDDYIQQRSRWAQGMTQILILANPLLANNLTIPQKLCYFNSSFFWLFSIARLIFYLGPALFLILGLKVYHASVGQMLIYALPHVISTFVVMGFFYGKVRRPFFSEIYESVQSIYLLPAVLSVILNPRRPTFKITPKGKTIESEFTNPMASAFLLVSLINIVAIFWAVSKWVNYPIYRDVIFVTFSWCVYNTLLSLATLGAFLERRQMRSNHRAKAAGEVSILEPDSRKYINGQIRDLSMTGIGIEVNVPFSNPEPDRDIMIAGHDSYGERYEFKAKVRANIKRGNKTILGLEFIADDKDTFAKVVRFVYGDSQRWVDILDSRTVSASSTGDMYYFAQRGVKGAAASFIYLNNMIYVLLKRYLQSLRIWIRSSHPWIKKETIYEGE
ncbi:MAG: UDP-forming cellulose synthase catalytic subunit [Deltaproteobacteria bacterium]|nr:UDP-forming cellulose synthase catalytic subunit [Deltaproteobacteria bacterium]